MLETAAGRPQGYPRLSTDAPRVLCLKAPQVASQHIVDRCIRFCALPLDVYVAKYEIHHAHNPFKSNPPSLQAFQDMLLLHHISALMSP